MTDQIQEPVANVVLIWNFDFIIRKKFDVFLCAK